MHLLCSKWFFSFFFSFLNMSFAISESLVLDESFFIHVFRGFVFYSPHFLANSTLTGGWSSSPA